MFTPRYIDLKQAAPETMPREIARCRAVLSVVTVAFFAFDHEHWSDASFGASVLFCVLIAHLLFSLVALTLVRIPAAAEPARRISPSLDAAFAVLVTAVAAGPHSPFLTFALFAIVATALDGSPRYALFLAATCGTLAVVLQLTLQIDNTEVVATRAVYLVLLGYLLIHLAEQRMRLEAALRAHEAAAQRRHFAQEIHDGCAQVLATVDVRLERLRQLVHQAQNTEALSEAVALRQIVRLEQEELRALSRRLVDLDNSPRVRPATSARPAGGTRCRLDVTCEGSADLITQLLTIIRQGIYDVQQHAAAARALVQVRQDDSTIAIDIEDDGVGFPSGAPPPWSISSRVANLGGSLVVQPKTATGGAHFSIRVPHK